MAMNPDDRYATAGELAAALRDSLKPRRDAVSGSEPRRRGSSDARTQPIRE